jgi:glycerol-3-phosphate dehydrogenase (NAD(P)+)
MAAFWLGAGIEACAAAAFAVMPLARGEGDAGEESVTHKGAIGVAGAGAWGMALANAAAAAGRDVVLWGRDPARMRQFEATRLNEKLPGVRLADPARATADRSELAACAAILLAVPAQATREAASQFASLRGSAPLVTCAKGIERGTHAFMTHILREAAPGRPAAILSGPSFAADVAAGLPTALTLASSDEALARSLCRLLHGPNLRLYHSTDVRGVEIGGAAKNVLAIACGVASGRGLGASAGAALIARGFSELRRFGEAFGAKGHTLMGLSGLGDLVLTCSSAQSRNFAFGLALGKGRSVQQALEGRLAEGASTALALTEMARMKGVDMPISNCVESLLEGTLDVAGAVGALLGRPQKSEE